MRRLYFGGSFNPIHHGHLICSRAVAEVAGYDQIVLIPTGQPPHKGSAAQLAASADRLAMLRLAVAGDPLFTIEDLELHRSGPSYTLDTVRELSAKGDKPIHWLIGADMLVFLPQWHRISELLAETHFVIMARPGWTMDWRSVPVGYRHLEGHVVEAPIIPISATDIRQRVAAGKSVRYLTPNPVEQYITSRGLYQPSNRPLVTTAAKA